MPILKIEERDMAEAILAFADFKRAQTGERQNEAQARLDSGEAPDEILRDLLGQIDPSGMAEKIGILRESVGLTDAATRAFWIGLTGLGIDHGDTEIEMGLFIALFLGVRASQAAQDRSAS